MVQFSRQFAKPLIFGPRHQVLLFAEEPRKFHGLLIVPAYRGQRWPR